jgi:hypothetical protein
MRVQTCKVVRGVALAVALATVACQSNAPTQPGSSPPPIPKRAQLDGQYTLTLEANCTPGPMPLPESIRKRSYDATLVQEETNLALKITGPNVQIRMDNSTRSSATSPRTSSCWGLAISSTTTCSTVR